jgi:4-hydroxybenzoate polyprenyltransferase
METAKPPLVVDLDGTLTPTDTLLESLIILIRRSVLRVFLLPLWLLKGRVGFKNAIAARVSIDVSLLPYHQELLAYLRAQKAQGRKIVLATAAHQSIAQAVSTHLGIFDKVLASDATSNLKGKTKLAAIKGELGESFVYAGDSKADLPIWRDAAAAILVGARASVVSQIQESIPIEREFAAPKRGLTVWLKALRVHQWAKNVLLFVPMLTAFAFEGLASILALSLAFLAFSVGASATYILNDLWDLENDRAHPRKCMRPFASAQLPISSGVLMVCGALVFAAGLAWVVSPAFLAMLLFYLVTTTVYSLVLKEYVLLDVIALSFLYTLRILAGAVAIGAAISAWLLVFSLFIFLSLALVKRCAELVSLGGSGEHATRGRDYQTSDLAVLWPLGVGAAMSSVVVFGLFINDPINRDRYATPELLWLVGAGLVYWLGRLWIKTSRGEMHDDPVVYALKNRGSRLTVIGMVVATLAAHFLRIPLAL